MNVRVFVVVSYYHYNDMLTIHSLCTNNTPIIATNVNIMSLAICVKLCYALNKIKHKNTCIVNVSSAKRL